MNMNILKYLKESNTEVPSYESFRNQLLNDFEMYYEDLMSDEDDIYKGTEDSYASEMIAQHLFDTIYYNIKGNYMSDDAAMQTANNVVNYIIDHLKHGEVISLQNDGVIREVYDKYISNKEESMNEAESIRDIADKSIKGNKLYDITQYYEDRLEDIGYEWRFKINGYNYFQREPEHYDDDVIMVEGDGTFAEKFDHNGESLIWNEDELHALLDK